MANTSLLSSRSLWTIVLCVAACPVGSQAADRAAHLFDELALSPDGGTIASIENDEPAEGAEPIQALVIRNAADGHAVTVTLPCGVSADCRPSDIAFTPDGKRVGFVLAQPNDPRRYIEEVKIDGSAMTQRLAFEGSLGGLAYDANGGLAFLATPGAHKESGAVKAGAPLAGEIGVSADEQRIATLEPSGVRFVSPPNLYVYEFAWCPNGAGFVGTAAPGNGDNEWWVAKLWGFPISGPATVLYAPPPARQLASPVVSPDGRSVAFIGGIMSDFGSTGGDAYSLALTPHARPVDLTPSMKASVTGLEWKCGSGLTAVGLRGSDTQIMALGAPSATPHVVWSGQQSLTTGSRDLSVVCAAGHSAAIHQTFTAPPEIETGTLDQWHDVSHANEGITVPATARSLSWRSDGSNVQGWLLQPTDRKTADNQPLITVVHGGPSAAYTPTFLRPNRDLWLLTAGYDVLLPNPRGSFGQGEAFTRANIRDFGHGDLRDIERGVDAAISAAPIDPAAVGIMGYSYGGYMTMWAVTQTNRFKAAVAGAGVSDWLSYYGENGIDEWMIPFFGASVYDDPAIYAKSSPINFVKNVHTPTFIFVGDRDLECPMPQSQEMWHALHTLGVPTEFVVYPGQGHELHDAKDRQDERRRSLAWFDRWLKPKT